MNFRGKNSAPNSQGKNLIFSCFLPSSDLRSLRSVDPLLPAHMFGLPTEVPHFVYNLESFYYSFLPLIHIYLYYVQQASIRNHSKTNKNKAYVLPPGPVLLDYILESSGVLFIDTSLCPSIRYSRQGPCSCCSVHSCSSVLLPLAQNASVHFFSQLMNSYQFECVAGLSSSQENLNYLA